MTGTWQRTATLEPGRLAFTGDVGTTEPHAHAALQLALNEGHRFHHLKEAGVGDVNLGLFTLVWDHLLGTFSYDPARRFASGQLAEPFQASGACHTEPSPPERTAT
ncbi:sterol desaturase family protein [Nonomuraea sp. NPDC050478]|uniref:sterol desaturase family protein n=1 Tax=Nonomuraea sp. NPDC050478 TaxID=3364365 RepID=UPI0037A894E7